MKKKISITINENIIHDVDSIIDNIYIRNRSQAIEYLVNNSLGSRKTAVILSGGAENSLLISKGEYRPLARIDGTTVIEMAIKKLRSDGFKRIFIIARHLVLTKIFNVLKEGADYGVEVIYVEEKDSKGSADSLKLLKGKIGNNFLVVFSDIIFKKINIEEFWNFHIKQNSVSTLLLTTTNDPSKKGIVRVEGNTILEFVQKPKDSDIYLVFSPIFVCSPEIFEYKGSSLEVDVFPKIAQQKLLKGYLSSEKEVHIHTKEDAIKASK